MIWCIIALVLGIIGWFTAGFRLIYCLDFFSMLFIGVPSIITTLIAFIVLTWMISWPVGMIGTTLVFWFIYNVVRDRKGIA